jgi:anti-sigma regulatory factor (Ser/Thr protein kinase)
VEAIRRAAFAFSGSEAPADDWTCVAMKVVEREVPLGRAGREIRSDLGELREAREFVRAACRDCSPPPLDEERIGQLELAVTEACSNIMKHAYHGRTDQRIDLEVEIYPGKVSVLLHHRGDPFVPGHVPPPAFDGSRESGFGLYLITQSVDAVRHYRDDRGRNCVALVKFRRPPVHLGAPRI